MNESEEPQHRVLDAESLKALAHPLRIRILDTLSVYGAQTATSLGERLGESSGATSYHLRQLEKHRFVREVEQRGTARERWWERTPVSIALEARQLPRDAAVRTASRVVEREWNRSRERLLADFTERGDDLLSDAWADAATVDTVNLQLTAEQLGDLVRELEAVVDATRQRFLAQKRHPVPGSRPVQVQLNAFPVLDAEETPMSVVPTTMTRTQEVER